MKKLFLLACCTLCFLGQLSAQELKALLKKIPTVQSNEKVQIMLLGSVHFGQDTYHKNEPKADLFSPEKQKEVAQINKMLLKYKPDMIMIEVNPEEQPSIDSLYTLFKTDKVELKSIEYGRAERYQFGYNLAKQLQHNRIYGVDHYESLSNRILANGNNIQYYTNALTEFSGVAKELEKGYKAGTISLKNFLLFMNAPKMLDFTYDVIYVTPAKVKNGVFVNAPTQYQDTTHIEKNYIGAEFISAFYERELKIYSNIVNAQIANGGKRLLVIMGQRHAAALPKIIANDPRYQVVPISKYIK